MVKSDLVEPKQNLVEQKYKKNLSKKWWRRRYSNSRPLGILCNFLESFGINFGILSNILEYYRIFCSFWKLLEFFGIFWNFGDCYLTWAYLSSDAPEMLSSWFSKMLGRCSRDDLEMLWRCLEYTQIGTYQELFGAY